MLEAAIAARKRTLQQSQGTDASILQPAEVGGTVQLSAAAAAAAAAEARAAAAGFQAVPDSGPAAAAAAAAQSRAAAMDVPADGGRSSSRQDVLQLCLQPVLAAASGPSGIYQQQQRQRSMPGVFEVLQEYHVCGSSRAFDLDVEGTLLVLAETGMGCNRLRKVSRFDSCEQSFRRRA